MAGRIVHVNDMPRYPNAVYIGRAVPRRGLKASRWANPYKIGHMGWDRETVVGLYETDLELARSDHPEHYMRPRVVARLDELPELRGKPLACWCRRDGQEQTDDTLCHGDALLALLDQYSDEQLRTMGREAR